MKTGKSAASQSVKMGLALINYGGAMIGLLIVLRLSATSAYNILDGDVEACNAEHTFKLAKGLQKTSVIMGRTSTISIAK